MRCAVVILPERGGDQERLLLSLAEARSAGSGDLTEFDLFSSEGGGQHEALLARAAERACDEGHDWLLVAGATELLAPDALVKIAPALPPHDAVWGGAGLLSTIGANGKPERVTRLAAQNRPMFFHAALCWWIGLTHFVRPVAAREAIRAVRSNAWYADYLAHLWSTARCYKTAQLLTTFEENIRPVTPADRARLVEHLALEPVFITVRHGPYTALLPYTGLNPVIEREQTRGLFFEDEELRYLAARFPSGLQIVDAGANTGNHTIFFATVMGAARVQPIEPEPRAIAALRAAAKENGLENVETSGLGFAVGKSAGRLSFAFSDDGGLGATRLVANGPSSVPVLPLDEVASGAVDLLKIDVEGMELDVLAGGKALISRHRPAIFIEVLDRSLPDFLRWVRENEYRVEKLFPDKTHCNYLLVPAEGWQRDKG